MANSKSTQPNSLATEGRNIASFLRKRHQTECGTFNADIENVTVFDPKKPIGVWTRLGFLAQQKAVNASKKQAEKAETTEGKQSDVGQTTEGTSSEAKSSKAKSQPQLSTPKEVVEAIKVTCNRSNISLSEVLELLMDEITSTAKETTKGSFEVIGKTIITDSKTGTDDVPF